MPGTIHTRRLLLASIAVLLMACLALPASGEESTPESWRAIQAAGPDLPVIGPLQTRHARDIESTPWSIGCETLGRDYWEAKT